MYELTQDDLQLLEAIGPKYTVPLLRDQHLLSKYIMAYSKKIINDYLQEKLDLDNIHPDYYHFINGIRIVFPTFLETYPEMWETLQKIILKYKKCNLC